MVVLGVFSILQFTSELLTVIQGFMGVLLVLIGAFIIWLESDEWKLKQQEKEESRELQQQFQPRKEQQAAQEDTETGEEAEKFACPQCGNEFDTERGMKIHQAQKHK